MESTLSDIAIQDPAEDMAAAVRDERERARQFLSNWRTTSQSLEEQLLSQIEATTRELSQSLSGGDADEADLQRKHNELADERMRLEKLKSDIAHRETEQRELHKQFATQHEQFAAQQESLIQRLTAQAEQLDARRDELAAQEIAIGQQRERFEQSQAGLEQRAAAIEGLLAKLDERENEIRQAETTLQQQRGELEQAKQQQSELNKQQSQLETQQAQLQEQQATLENERQAMVEVQQQLEQRKRQLDELAAQTEASRKQIARELKVRRAEQLVEIEKKRGELELIVAGEDADFERQLGQLQDELVRLNGQTQQRGQEADELRRQLEAAHGQIDKRDAEIREVNDRLEQMASAGHHSAGETAELAARLAEAQEKYESQQAAAQSAVAQARDEQQQLRSELQQAEARCDEAQQQVAKLQEQIGQFQQEIDAAGDNAAHERIRELEQERDALVERLSDAEQVGSHGTADGDELRGRLESALEEVRTLRQRNTELDEKLAKGVAGGGGAVGGAMDWEAQKQRMLAQLESDCDEDSPEKQKERLTIEGTINITDSIVSEREREIAELKRLLDDQSKNIGGMAVGAAAIAEMLDGDELIQQERANLEALQQEWREKLRKAEIDISVERAKFARERAQLEDKLQAMQQASISDGNDGDGDDGKKPKRGRWLARLGLGDEEK